MSYLTLEGVSKSYGAVKALQCVDLEMAEGEILAVLGPSGCGKTTLLRVIAGLENADTGRVLLRGRDLAEFPPHRRGVGLMFQDYGLFPHLDVARNIAFGLRMQGMPAVRRRERVREMLGLVKLQAHAAKSILSLSGGEQQRVALARSLAPFPSLLMLDEPLGALDAVLCDELTGEVPRILRQARATALYVTHDSDEAFSVADRIALMRSGKITRIGTPREILFGPSDAFTAVFLGLGAVLPAVVRDGNLETDIGGFPLHGDAHGGGGECRVLIRPERVRLHGPEAGCIQVRARIVRLVPHAEGTRVRLLLLGRSGVEYELSVAMGPGPTKDELPGPGSEIRIGIESSGAEILNPG
jgi:thiamine transport system ATP-binding protein